MARYDYVCKDCGQRTELVLSIHDELPEHLHCTRCGNQATRRYEAPAFHRFAEHYNHTVGEGVSSKKDFEIKLHEAQEKMSERLGFQQHYSVVEPQTIVNDEGMAATHDHRKASGLST